MPKQSNPSSSSSTLLEILSDGSQHHPKPVPISCPCPKEEGEADVSLLLKGKDGRNSILHLHKHTLEEGSEFLRGRLSEKSRSGSNAPPHFIEIVDCDDLEAFQDSIQLLYSEDRSSTLAKCSVPKVIGILKASSVLVSEACILSCLEHLEAVPWTEEEEEMVRSVLNELKLDNGMTADVLRRVQPEDYIGREETLMHLIQMVLKGRDEKGRREMKALISRMLRENASPNCDVSKDGLYSACTVCIGTLVEVFTQSCAKMRGGGDRGRFGSEISREVDNLVWLLEILIDRGMAESFVGVWAHQAELVGLHGQVAVMVRFQVSRVTARLCVAIGKGEVVCSGKVRYQMLQTWLPPLVDDFGWMQRCCRGMDKNVVEEGIGQAILTLPLPQQQTILMNWLDRFSTNGDDCPNLHKAFQVWWRRTFFKPPVIDKSSTSTNP